jgi:hypothetical protein
MSAGRYDGANVDGNDRLRSGSSFSEGHRGATETMFSRYFLFVVFTLILAGRAAFAEDSNPVILKEDFEHGFSRWKTSDPDPAKSVWKIIETGPKGNHALRCTGIAKYEPKYRSPFSYALLKDVKVTDFELTLRCQETHVDAGPHRDLCIFWGYQDPTHFYYAHLGAKADPHACQIFIVNDAPRTMITVDQAKGTPWTEDWHNVKVERTVADGSMKVYFDDMKKPYMTANDKTFTWGQIGIGTFDDHGNFDDVVLRGKLAKPKP